MKWKSTLLSLFNIQASEVRLVSLTLAYALLLYAANVLVRMACYALFLTQFDATMLPYAYIGISIVAPLVSAVIMRLNQRLPLGKVLLGVHGFLLLTLLSYGVGLNITAVSGLLFTLPIYFGVNNSLTISSFWNLLGRVFNLQQGKRLFGLLSAGEHVATILAGFLAPLLINWLGISNLFFVASFIIVVTIILLNQIVRQHADTMGKVQVNKAQTSSASSQQSDSLFKNAYVRLIIGLFALFIVGIYFVDNIFYSQAELQFANEDALASFIGIFFGAFGVLSLIIQAFVVGRVLNRFGVRAMILATPVGLLILMGLFALLGSLGVGTAVLFTLAVLANLYRLILDAVDSAAVNVMYQPLPAHQRTQAQTTVVGIIYPLAIGAAGLALLFFTNVLGFTPVWLAYIALLVLGMWLAVGIRLGRAYPRQVQDALAQRLFQGNAQLPFDEEALDIIRQSRNSPHAGVVLYALDTLMQHQPEAMADLWPELLTHPVPEVRQEVLTRIEKMGLGDAVTAVSQHIPQESSPEVLAVALRTLATLASSTVLSEIEPFLAHKNVQIRQGAFIGLLRNADTDVREDARQRLKHLAHTSDKVERQLAANIIAETGDPACKILLPQLLNDPDLSVRQAALTAAAHFPDLWPTLIDALAVPETRKVATMSLMTAGETAVSALQNAFATTSQPEVQQEIIYILGRMGTPDALAFLSNHLNHPDHIVRRQILMGLNQVGFQVAAKERSTVFQQIRAEGQHATAIIQMILDLQQDAQQEELFLLLNALQRMVALHQEHIFHLLSLVYDSDTLGRVWAILQPTAPVSSEQQAYAQEVMELTIDKDILPLVRPFAHKLGLPEQLAQLNVIFPQKSRSCVQHLRDLLQNLQPQLQLCALYTVGRLKLYDETIAKDVINLAHSREKLIAETAVWSLSQLDEQLIKTFAMSEAVAEQINQWQQRPSPLLPTMGRVEALLKTSLFHQIQARALINVATQLIEVQYAAADPIFMKGDAGDSMYMIVSGKVRVHDGDHTLNFLATADVFGEMALLEAEPRTASVTAMEPTHLLRLDQAAFQDLLQSQPSLSRGIIQVLSHHLRERVRDLVELQGETQPLPTAVEAVNIDKATAVKATLSPMERIILLKRVDMFRSLPNNILTELALLLQDVQLKAEMPLFVKGDVGDALYIIAQGEVRVHDNGHTVNHLYRGQVFGEMALLDTVPRMAGITAVVPTSLLRLDQGSFYQLLEGRAEITIPIVQTLSNRLRNRMKELTALR
ncbi:MAG: cyclic nucleotide-binding domain-containing protein [Ardenticatenaceae bacterium]|nr:cyclic nucleotide-binding domain-containing protein [Ardenticatenaceae bacterium]